MSVFERITLKIKTAIVSIDALVKGAENSRLDALEEELGSLNGQISDMQDCSQQEIKIVNDALDDAYARFNHKRTKVFKLTRVERPAKRL